MDQSKSELRIGCKGWEQILLHSCPVPARLQATIKVLDDAIWHDEGGEATIKGLDDAMWHAEGGNGSKTHVMNRRAWSGVGGIEDPCPAC